MIDKLDLNPNTGSEAGLIKVIRNLMWEEDGKSKLRFEDVKALVWGDPEFVKVIDRGTGRPAADQWMADNRALINEMFAKIDVEIVD